MTTNDKPIAEMTYEEAFAALEAIVLRLEEEAHTLETTLELYARGQALAAHCQALLEQAELHLETLRGSD